METRLLLTAYKTLTVPIRRYHLWPPMTYCLVTIPNDWHLQCVMTLQGHFRSSIFMSFESQYATSY